MNQDYRSSWNRTTLNRNQRGPGLLSSFPCLKVDVVMGTYNLYSSFVELVGWYLPRAVVEIRVPRRPGAVEGERQLLVVLVFLTPHPEGGEHILTQETQGESVQKKRRGDHIHGKVYTSMEHGEYWQRGGQVRGGARKRAGLAGACAQKRASLRRWAAERGGRVRGMEHLY